MSPAEIEDLNTEVTRALRHDYLLNILAGARRRDKWRNVAYCIWTVVGLLALVAWQW